MNLTEKLTEQLADLENYSNELIPLKEVFSPVQDDIKLALEDLRNKANNSEDIADKIFYLNRYTDLLKKIDSVFDARSRRLQNVLQSINKLNDVTPTVEDIKQQINIPDGTALTPEQYNAIFNIIKTNN